MKPSYFDLLNPVGVRVRGVGLLKSPTLMRISEIGKRQYDYLLSLLMMTPKDFLNMAAKAVGGKDAANPYDELSEEQKRQLNIFDLLTQDKVLRDELIQALSLFCVGNLEWNQQKNAVMVGVDKQGEQIFVDGKIDRDNFAEVSSLCLEMVRVERKKPETLKFKDEASRKFYERFMQKKEKFNEHKKQDPKYELANIISSVAAYHNSLNLLNIWNLTVFQLYDAYAKQQVKGQCEIQSLNYSVWGGTHDPELWLNNIYQQNKENAL